MNARHFNFDSRTATPDQLNQFRRSSYGVPLTAPAYKPKNAEGMVYVWNIEMRGRAAYRIVAFAGKQTKAALNVYTYQKDRAEARVKEFISGLEASADWKLQRKARQREQLHGELDKYAVGAILRATGGYNRTWNEYYQIVARKGQSVTIRRIGSNTVSGDMGWSGTEEPVKDAFLVNEPEMTKRITANGVKVDHYKHASLWDGRPDYFNTLD